MSSTLLQAIRQNGNMAMRKFQPNWSRVMSTMPTSSIFEAAKAAAAASALLASSTTATSTTAGTGASVPPVTPSAPITPATSHVPIVPSDEVVSQLVNTLMRDGKKARAQRLVSDSMKHLSKKLDNDNPYTVLLEAIETASPLLKLSTTKKGSKVVHVPTALKERQRRRRAIVWMLDASKKRGEKSFEERFAAEVYDVSQGVSLVLQKKQQIHKQALANRANAQVSYNTQR